MSITSENYTKDVYVIASEFDNGLKAKSNIIIHCCVPTKMTMHVVEETLKDIVKDFAMDENGLGKKLIEENNYEFDWVMFASYIRNDRALKYGIEIKNIIESAPSVDMHQNLLRDEDLDDVYPEGLL